MTEYNIFCYSENYNDNFSFQQDRFRVFNTLVSEKRYNELKSLINLIIPNNNKLPLNAFWKSITNNQWLQLLNIPEAKGFKAGFEYISGIDLSNISNNQLLGKEVKVVIDNITYSATVNSIL